VAIIHDEVKETIRAHLTLLHVFHVYASADTPWVAYALSHFTSIRYGRIASVSAAHDARLMAAQPTWLVGPRPRARGARSHGVGRWRSGRILAVPDDEV
jgi:hypothetical protein